MDAGFTLLQLLVLGESTWRTSERLWARLGGCVLLQMVVTIGV